MNWTGRSSARLLLGTVQQLVQVTISSAWNLLIVGVLLVVFVDAAPKGSSDGAAAAAAWRPSKA